MYLISLCLYLPSCRVGIISHYEDYRSMLVGDHCYYFWMPRLSGSIRTQEGGGGGKHLQLVASDRLTPLPQWQHGSLFLPGSPLLHPFAQHT